MGVLEQHCLKHHGVKGMKWGVRRYQNPDGTLTAAGKKHYSRTTTLDQDLYNPRDVGDIRISTKSKLYRLSKVQEKADHYRKYVYTEQDADYYENVGFKNRLYKLTMTPLRELKIAGRKETVEAFMDVHNVKLSELNKGRSYKYSLYDNDDLANISYYMSERFGRKGLDLMGNEKLTSDMVQRLSKKGYDGMVDINDLYLYYGNGKTPMIIFDPQNAVSITDIADK